MCIARASERRWWEMSRATSLKDFWALTPTTRSILCTKCHPYAAANARALNEHQTIATNSCFSLCLSTSQRALQMPQEVIPVGDSGTGNERRTRVACVRLSVPLKKSMAYLVWQHSITNTQWLLTRPDDIFSWIISPTGKTHYVTCLVSKCQH